MLSLSLLSACNREKIEVYRLAKDPDGNAPVPMASNSSRADDLSNRASLPSVKWVLPKGWEEEQASGMRVGSFAVKDSEGHKADIAIIPIGVTGRELDLVNLWRQQLQLADFTAEKMASIQQPVSINDLQGKLFEFESDKPSENTSGPVGVLAAILEKDGITWSIKMAGDINLVKAQKGMFIDFLKTIKIEASDVTMSAPTTHGFSANAKQAPRSDEVLPHWVVPSDWQPAPASPPLTAKYVVNGNDGKADVNILMLGGAGGGAAANINRWRRQLGLAEVEAAAAEKLASVIDLANGKGSLVQLDGTDVKTGQPARLLAVIVPRGQETWFYKLMGNPAVVDSHKTEFLGFVRDTVYPNAQ